MPPAPPGFAYVPSIVFVLSIDDLNGGSGDDDDDDGSRRQLRPDGRQLQVSAQGLDTLIAAIVDEFPELAREDVHAEADGNLVVVTIVPPHTVAFAEMFAAVSAPLFVNVLSAQSGTPLSLWAAPTESLSLAKAIPSPAVPALSPAMRPALPPQRPPVRKTNDAPGDDDETALTLLYRLQHLDTSLIAVYGALLFCCVCACVCVGGARCILRVRGTSKSAINGHLPPPRLNPREKRSSSRRQVGAQARLAMLVRAFAASAAVARAHAHKLGLVTLVCPCYTRLEGPISLACFAQVVPGFCSMDEEGDEAMDDVGLDRDSTDSTHHAVDVDSDRTVSPTPCADDQIELEVSMPGVRTPPPPPPPSRPPPPAASPHGPPVPANGTKVRAPGHPGLVPRMRSYQSSYQSIGDVGEVLVE